MAAEPHNIEVRPNNAITNDPCALCGRRCDPVGIDPFVADTWELVCDDCARRHGVGDVLDEFRDLDDEIRGLGEEDR